MIHLDQWLWVMTSSIMDSKLLSLVLHRALVLPRRLIESWILSIFINNKLYRRRCKWNPCASSFDTKCNKGVYIRLFTSCCWRRWWIGWDLIFDQATCFHQLRLWLALIHMILNHLNVHNIYLMACILILSNNSWKNTKFVALASISSIIGTIYSIVFITQ